MVGRFVQQQQVRLGEQRRCQGHPHAPAAAELRHGAGLGGGVEPQSGQDGGGAGGGCVGADGAQALVDFRQAGRERVIGLNQQGEPLRVALQHRVQQAGRARRRFLADLRHAGAGSQVDGTAIQRQFAGDGAQEGGFASAIAPDQSDAPPGIDPQGGVLQQRTAGHSEGSVVDDQQTHGCDLAIAPAGCQGIS